MAENLSKGEQQEVGDESQYAKVIPFPTSLRNLPIRAHRAGFLSIPRSQVILQFLCAVHVFAGFGADHLLRAGVLLPLEGQHEQLQCGVVKLISLLVLALIVVLDRLLDRVNRSS